jgi:flagellar basal-body rod protein FlgC
MSGIFKAIDVASTGMTVQRQKMDVVSENIANIDTSRTSEGGPYRRQKVVVSEANSRPSFSRAMSSAHDKLTRTNPLHIKGQIRAMNDAPDMNKVSGKEIRDPESSFKLVYDPSHPDADNDGYVQMPDIEMINEMVDMIAANRAYEANIATVSASKQMLNEALDI